MWMILATLQIRQSYITWKVWASCIAGMQYKIFYSRWQLRHLKRDIHTSWKIFLRYSETSDSTIMPFYYIDITCECITLLIRSTFNCDIQLIFNMEPTKKSKNFKTIDNEDHSHVQSRIYVWIWWSTSKRFYLSSIGKRCRILSISFPTIEESIQFLQKGILWIGR